MDQQGKATINTSANLYTDSVDTVSEQATPYSEQATP